MPRGGDVEQVAFGEDGLAFQATLPANLGERGRRPSATSDPSAKAAGSMTALSTSLPANLNHRLIEVHRALRNFHLLLRSERLYEKNHPSRLDSLDSAYDSLRQVAESLEGLEIRIERGGIVTPQLSDGHLPDARGEMQALAADLQRVGVCSLAFSQKLHVRELHTLARVKRESLLKSGEPASDAGT